MVNKLNIIANDRQPLREKSPFSVKTAKLVATAENERNWLNQNAFNESALEIETIRRTLHVLEEVSAIKGKKIADLGCGSGALSLKLALLGADVDAVDIASNALKLVKEHPNIHKIQDFVPETSLKDQSYDIVIAANLVAELPKNLQRLFFSELIRLGKSDGFIICSTPLDFNTEAPLQAFLQVASAELTILKIETSSHRLWIKIAQFLKSFGRYSTFLWKAWLKSPKMLAFSEKLSGWIWGDEGISHVIFLAKRKPLVKVPTGADIPLERPRKKTVWE